MTASNRGPGTRHSPAPQDAQPVAEDAAARIRDLARAEGFDLVRVASAETMIGARETALAREAGGNLADMSWMTPEWLERATDPNAFLDGARTVILLALPYAPSQPDTVPETHARGRIAHYARGRDYHRVFEKKLRRIARTIRDEFDAGARATVDYGPLLERPLAARAGMGWLGKSTMLLVPGFGPWVLLGAIATTLELPTDAPLKKTCGACTRCIVACPTGAISPDGHVVDARLCISYHTIENRGPVPRDLRPLFKDWIFGCDDCLTSCPVGAGHRDGYPDFEPPDAEAATPALSPLLSLSEDQFTERFRGRAIMRAKRDGFLRNVCVALGNVGTVDDIPPLAAALEDSAPLVRGHAAWALARLAERHASPIPVRPTLEARLQREDDPFARAELEAAIADLGAVATADRTSHERVESQA